MAEFCHSALFNGLLAGRLRGKMTPNWFVQGAMLWSFLKIRLRSPWYPGRGVRLEVLGVHLELKEWESHFRIRSSRRQWLPYVGWATVESETL